MVFQALLLYIKELRMIITLNFILVTFIKYRNVLMYHY